MSAEVMLGILMCAVIMLGMCLYFLAGALVWMLAQKYIMCRKATWKELWEEW